MTDDRMFEAVEAAYPELLARAEERPRTGCPTLEEILAAAEARGRERTRIATINHIAGCGSCLEEFRVLRSVSAARPAPSRLPRSWWSLAAGLLLILGVGYAALRLTGAPDPVVRGPANAGLIQPSGAVASADLSFAWHPVPWASRYQVRITTSAGDSVRYAVATDSVLRLEAGALPAGSYIWWVIAESETGSRRELGPAAFEVR